MKRTFFLMILAAVVAVGCGEAENPESQGGSVIGTGEVGGGGEVNDGGAPGSGREAVSLPDDLPDDVPIYTGAKATFVGTSEGGIRQSPSTTIQLETADSVEAVHAFYAERMEEHSWTINLDTPALLNGKKEKRNLNVTIAEMPRSPGTVSVTIVFN